MSAYIYAIRLAKKQKGVKWLGLARWNPLTGSSCIAVAEDAFRLAGYDVKNDGGFADVVYWEDRITQQKNYRPSDQGLADVPFTVEQVTEFRDLQRAKDYIARGWDLECQPEAKAAAIRAGLLKS